MKRLDALAAKISARIHNAHVSKKRDAVDPKDEMPEWGPKRTIQVEDPEETLTQWFKAMTGAEDKR